MAFLTWITNKKVVYELPDDNLKDIQDTIGTLYKQKHFRLDIQGVSSYLSLCVHYNGRRCPTDLDDHFYPLQVTTSIFWRIQRLLIGILGISDQLHVAVTPYSLYDGSELIIQPPTPDRRV